MNMFAAFCRAIDDGLFDEVEGAEKNGEQRLKIATEPFLSEGAISKEEHQKLSERLDERRQERSRTTRA
jgi:hypothetical protein